MVAPTKPLITPWYTPNRARSAVEPANTGAVETEIAYTKGDINVAPIIGGVVASLLVAAIALYVFLVFYLRKRAAKTRDPSIDEILKQMGVDIDDKDSTKGAHPGPPRTDNGTEKGT